MTWLALALALALAFANGANDNFKGVATLYGSGTASYRISLVWGTVATLAGSLLSLWLASGLIESFSGSGLVPREVAGSAHLLAAVALAATATVLLATRLGFPVSTTHALIGALVGAGAVAGSVQIATLERSFLIPLALSPALAIGIAGSLHPVATTLRRRARVLRELCVCVDRKWVPVGLAPRGALVATPRLGATVSTTERCRERYQGARLGVSAQSLIDVAHFASAGAVSLARGLNDTPKIVALVLASSAVGRAGAVPLVAIVIAAGGLLFARRVAETISHRITALTPGQGLIANLTSAALVIAASGHGLPVSTTHVTSGSLIGIGAITGTARWKTIGSILAAWLITLPLGAGLGAAAYVLLG